MEKSMSQKILVVQAKAAKQSAAKASVIDEKSEGLNTGIFESKTKQTSAPKVNPPVIKKQVSESPFGQKEEVAKPELTKQSSGAPKVN
jgi:hypothetical protein